MTAAAHTHGLIQVSSSRVSRPPPAAHREAQPRPSQSGGNAVHEGAQSRSGRVFWEWTSNLTAFSQHLQKLLIIIYSFIEVELIYNIMHVECTTCTLNIYTYVCIDMHIHICAFI